MADFNHCLRPILTARVVRQLQRGRSLNLIGGETAERERLLEDICRMTFPDTTILCANMKNYRPTYAGLMRELWAQTGRDGEELRTISEMLNATRGMWLRKYAETFA